jgi:hypothetical protein
VEAKIVLQNNFKGKAGSEMALPFCFRDFSRVNETAISPLSQEAQERLR